MSVAAYTEDSCRRCVTRQPAPRGSILTPAGEATVVLRRRRTFPAQDTARILLLILLLQELNQLPPLLESLAFQVSVTFARLLGPPPPAVFLVTELLVRL